MYPKTDSSEFASGFLWQVALLTLVVLSLIVFADQVFKPGERERVPTPRIVLFPWVIAGAHTIDNGLRAFSGKQTEAVNGKDQVRALAGLLIVSVLCPTIFLMRWRRRTLQQTTPTVWNLSRLFYSLCGALVLYLVIASLPTAVTADLSHRRLRDAQAVQSSRDGIINDLNEMAIDLSLYYMLPKELGGGNHSYEGYKVPEASTKTSEATYTFRPSAQTVTIHAESVRYPSSSVEMKVDSLGRINSWAYGGKFQ
ncbi:MAG: hypothetical protein NTU47_03060 [Ignavibacteriales bacterium]|nr:hypothetical protein [Ignavibacteriales bacterium]